MNLLNPNTKTGTASTASLRAQCLLQEQERAKQKKETEEKIKERKIKEVEKLLEQKHAAEEICSAFKTGNSDWKKISVSKLRSAYAGLTFNETDALLLGSSAKKDEVIKAIEDYLCLRHTVSEPRPCREIKRPKHFDE